jgi:peptidoglycan/LPS O-acetylase OafA/YrhL
VPPKLLAPQFEESSASRTRFWDEITIRRKSSYIPTLDGWRAIAVSLVIAAHCYTMLLNSHTRAGALLARFVSHAGYGVDIFFALSGYLICTLLLQEKARTGTISLGRFYTRRVFRILPPILVYLITLLILAQCKLLPRIPAVEFLRVLFFARNYFQGSWYTGHFWSLAVEEHFYLAAPLFFLLLTWKRALQIALVLTVAGIGIRWLEFSHSMFAGSLLQFRTENRFDALLWGAILALLLHQPTIRLRIAARLTGLVAVLTGIGGALLLNLFSSQPSRRTVVAFVLPILIAQTVLHAESLFGRLLELSFLRWIGRLSYSLYIWQMLFLPDGPRPLGRLQSFPLALICPLLCAVVSYYWVEKPMIRLGHKLASSPGEQQSRRRASTLETASALPDAG